VGISVEAFIFVGKEEASTFLLRVRKDGTG